MFANCKKNLFQTSFIISHILRVQISLNRQFVLSWLASNSNKTRTIVYTTLCQEERSSGSVHGLFRMQKMQCVVCMMMVVILIAI